MKDYQTRLTTREREQIAIAVIAAATSPTPRIVFDPIAAFHVTHDRGPIAASSLPAPRRTP